MQAIPLGLVTVPTAGTPVVLPLTAAQIATIPPSGMVAKIEVWPNPAASGRVYVKRSGAIVAALPVPTGGYPVPWSTPDCDHNAVQWAQFTLDAANSGDGAYVTLWVA